MYFDMAGRIIIITAPSGSGKTTIVRHLLNVRDLNLEFSVSACTRPMRDGEINGKDYYFMTPAAFRDRIRKKDFLEWEEVYKGSFYGTLKSEVDRILGLERNVLFDVDVRGAVNLKKKFGSKALAIFVMAPSLEVLQQRLESRGTETRERIAERILKASQELVFKDRFDRVLVNDKLHKALNLAETWVREFIEAGMT